MIKFDVSTVGHGPAQSRRDALDRAYTRLYPELCRIARARLHRVGQRDLDSNALVHESFLRLVSLDAPVDDPVHFCAYAARTMQSIAIDAERGRGATRRGGGVAPVSLEQVGDMPSSIECLAPDPTSQPLHDALLALEAVDPESARMVRLRHFEGCSEREIAALTGASRRTVRRQWERARELLQALLQD
jgi:RNA polymerase sigma factor (TIGR02999 family)